MDFERASQDSCLHGEGEDLSFSILKMSAELCFIFLWLTAFQNVMPGPQKVISGIMETEDLFAATEEELARVRNGTADYMPREEFDIWIFLDMIRHETQKFEVFQLNFLWQCFLNLKTIQWNLCLVTMSSRCILLHALYMCHVGLARKVQIRWVTFPNNGHAVLFKHHVYATYVTQLQCPKSRNIKSDW